MGKPSLWTKRRASLRLSRRKTWILLYTVLRSFINLTPESNSMPQPSSRLPSSQQHTSWQTAIVWRKDRKTTPVCSQSLSTLTRRKIFTKYQTCLDLMRTALCTTEEATASLTLRNKFPLKETCLTRRSWKCLDIRATSSNARAKKLSKTLRLQLSSKQSTKARITEWS